MSERIRMAAVLGGRALNWESWLAALCLLLAWPGRADARNNAQFVSQSTPTTMTAGECYTVSVTMKNTGTSTWTRGGNYRLGSQHPQDNLIWGLGRVDLDPSDAIAPGQSKTFTFDVMALGTPGTYNFQWRMLREHVEWFGEFTPNVMINVADETTDTNVTGETIDTLDYFITKHPDRGLTGTHPQSQMVVGQRSFYVKWASDTFEIHRWDGSYIYLQEDHGGAPNSTYSFSPGIWMKRSMRVGETIDMRGNRIQSYDSLCKPTTSAPFPYEMTLEAHIPNLDIGGDLGIQDVIVLKYDYFGCPRNYEKFYYSREWGWIKWELYKGSTLLQTSTFNRIGGRPASPGVGCTISADTSPPTVSITSPANGAMVSGTVIIAGTAADNRGVTQVELYLDAGAAPFTTLNSPPSIWSYDWNTRSVSNGSHTLTAKTYDAAGNVGTSTSATVTVSN
jgi:Bacterial Ig domain/Ig-like domain from next to BRCA1 gene